MAILEYVVNYMGEYARTDLGKELNSAIKSSAEEQMKLRAVSHEGLNFSYRIIGDNKTHIGVVHWYDSEKRAEKARMLFMGEEKECLRTKSELLKLIPGLKLE